MRACQKSKVWPRLIEILGRELMGDEQSTSKGKFRWDCARVLLLIYGIPCANILQGEGACIFEELIN
jgi:hypothetical protein